MTSSHVSYVKTAAIFHHSFLFCLVARSSFHVQWSEPVLLCHFYDFPCVIPSFTVHNALFFFLPRTVLREEGVRENSYQKLCPVIGQNRN